MEKRLVCRHVANFFFYSLLCYLHSIYDWDSRLLLHLLKIFTYYSSFLNVISTCMRVNICGSGSNHRRERWVCFIFLFSCIEKFCVRVGFGWNQSGRREWNEVSGNDFDTQNLRQIHLTYCRVIHMCVRVLNYVTFINLINLTFKKLSKKFKGSMSLFFVKFFFLIIYWSKSFHIWDCMQGLTLIYI